MAKGIVNPARQFSPLSPSWRTHDGPGGWQSAKGYPPDGGLGEAGRARKAVAFVIGTQSCDFQGFFHARIVKKTTRRPARWIWRRESWKARQLSFRNICGLEGCGRLFGIDCDRAGVPSISNSMRARLAILMRLLIITLACRIIL